MNNKMNNKMNTLNTLTIDSVDRNWFNSDKTFDFSFNFLNTNNMGVLNKVYKNITKLNLIRLLCLIYLLI